MQNILLSGLIVLCSFTLEVITGFGGTVIAVSFVTSLLGMHTGVVVLTFVAMIPQISVVIRNRKSIDWRNYLIIVCIMLPFLFVGRLLQGAVDSAVLKRILAVFIILVSVLRLIRFFRSGKKEDEDNEEKPVKWYAYPALVGAGLVHGMFSSGGPLAIIYATTAIRKKDSFRATLCLLWVTLNTILSVTYIADGSVTGEVLKTVLIMVPFVICGVVLGNLVNDKVNEKIFTLLVYICLLVTGIFMLI